MIKAMFLVIRDVFAFLTAIHPFSLTKDQLVKDGFVRPI